MSFVTNKTKTSKIKVVLEIAEWNLFYVFSENKILLEFRRNLEVSGFKVQGFCDII